MNFLRLGFSEPFETAGPEAKLRQRVKNVVRFSFITVMNGAALAVGAFGLSFGVAAGVRLAGLLF